MKKSILFISACIGLSLLFVSKLTSQKTSTPQSDNIQWISIEEANQLAQKEAKPILIDVYTDWCKFCKVMDEKTFNDSEMIAFVNQHFYPVKLDAEQKEDINFNGKTYSFVANGRRGINTITPVLLGDRPAYPSLILLNSGLSEKQVLKGFKEKEVLLPILSKYVENNLLTSK